MATQVQNRRGTTAEHSTFTGAVGELTVDTTKDTVVVHDGAVAGGRPLLREDQSNLPTSAPTTGIYNASGSLAISTGGSGRLFVDANGNIAVGTSATSNFGATARSFDINSAGGIANLYVKTGTVNGGLQADASNGYMQVWTASNHPIAFNIAFSEKMRLDTSGRLGVGTSTPSAVLHAVAANDPVLFLNRSASDGEVARFLVGGNTAFSFSTTAGGIRTIDGGNADFRIRTNSADRLTVTSSGNVGVGSTSDPGGFNARLWIDNTADSTLTLNTTGSSSLSQIVFRNSNVNGEARLMNGTGGPLTFYRSFGNEAARIDTSGRLLVGTSTSGSSLLQVNAQASAAGNGLRSSHQIANSGTGVTQTTQAAPYISYLNGLNVGLDATAIAINGEDFASGNTGLRLEFNLLKSSGAVASGDRLGRISFGGDDGTSLIPGAWIDAFVDGGVSANDLPTRLVFSTTADGASSPTERMRIGNNGNIGIGVVNSSTVRVLIRSVNNSGGEYSLRVENASGTTSFYVGNDGLISTGTGGASPTNNTTASAANVFVDSAGILQRSTSSLKYKTDVYNAEHGLSELLSLRPVTYKGKAKTDEGKVFGGLIAEEVHDAGLVEFVQYAEDGSPDALAYGNMVSLCIKAIQEQQAMIVELQAKVAALESV